MIPRAFLRRLKREIVIVLTVKLCIVLAAALFVFGPRQRPHIDADAVRAQMLSPSPHPDHGADQ
jgi:hypothetical protein